MLQRLPGTVEPSHQPDTVEVIAKSARLKKGGCAIHDGRIQSHRRLGIPPARFMGQFNPMLIPDVDKKVILSFDSPIPNTLAPLYWAIEAFLKMLHLMVTS